MAIIDEQCSNCGARIVSDDLPMTMFDNGFRAVGDAGYCPTCVKSWAKRNGREFGKDIKRPAELFCNWWGKMVLRSKQRTGKERLENQINSHSDFTADDLHKRITNDCRRGYTQYGNSVAQR